MRRKVSYIISNYSIHIHREILCGHDVFCVTVQMWLGTCYLTLFALFVYQASLEVLVNNDLSISIYKTLLFFVG